MRGLQPLWAEPDLPAVRWRIARLCTLYVMMMTTAGCVMHAGKSPIYRLTADVGEVIRQGTGSCGGPASGQLSLDLSPEVTLWIHHSEDRPGQPKIAVEFFVEQGGVVSIEGPIVVVANGTRTTLASMKTSRRPEMIVPLPTVLVGPPRGQKDAQGYHVTGPMYVAEFPIPQDRPTIIVELPDLEVGGRVTPGFAARYEPAEVFGVAACPIM